MAAKPPTWKANLLHLRVAMDRLIQNFSAHSGVSKEEALRQVEAIVKEIRKREEKK